MSEEKKDVRREKPDAADAKDPKETYLPGQVPLDQPPEAGPEGEERQPNPVEAEKAVNPDLIPVKERKRA